MSHQVETSLVNTYKSNIEIQFQQKGSRLRDTVMNGSQKAEFDFYDRIGPTDVVENTSRHSDTPLIQTTHDRRRLGLKDYDWADMIDKKDKIRMLADPTSPYTMNAVYAFGRQMDRTIITAATAVAYTGKTGTTQVAHPAASQVAVDYVETGAATNSNLTIGKLRYIRFLLTSTEVVSEEDEELITAVVTASQIQSLLRTTEVTSADYNTVKALVAGNVDTFMGFKFKRTQLLPKSGNNRTNLFYPKSAIQLAWGEDVTVDVGPRRDKRNSTQVYVCMSLGASRMWEEKVISVLCDETK